MRMLGHENRPKDRERKIENNRWLETFARSFTSQFGEDGIIEKALEIVGNSDKWCVEFGCWDGKHLSNTLNLIENKGYSAVLIEGDKKKFRDLLKTCQGNDKVIPLNLFVGFEKRNGLDAILQEVEIPVDFDVLSIDIDGNDYHVWKAVECYKPKIVVIEYNPTIPNKVEFVQKPDMRVLQGSSLLSIHMLAKSKKYELIAVTTTNAIFVDSRYFDLFGIRDNSVEAMRPDEKMVTHIFCGYDGTVFIKGFCRLPWHSVRFSESRIQQLPSFLRSYPETYGKLKQVLLRVYKKLRKKNIL
jgi:hypothetical protein